MTIDSPLYEPPTHTRELIEASLDRFFAERVQVAQRYGAEFTRLWELTAESSRGGKLLRPRLFADALEGFSAADGAQGRYCASGSCVGLGDAGLPEWPDDETADRLAAVIEVLHYAFLLHDDVIDGDVVRRHRPNLVGAVRDLHRDSVLGTALHWGTSAAILMGDLLLSAAVLDCASMPLPASARVRVIDLIDEAITESVAGEYLDVGLGDGMIVPDMRTVREMTTLKTATYSFALPLRLAGALAGASPEVDRALAAAGRDLGFAFQVQDDLLTMFGSYEGHGKDVLSDLREGKQTVLVTYVRTTDRWDEIARVFGDPDVDTTTAAHVRRVIEESGAKGFSEDLVEAHLSRALRHLEESEVPAPVCAVVAACVDRIRGRAS